MLTIKDDSSAELSWGTSRCVVVTFWLFLYQKSVVKRSEEILDKITLKFYPRLWMRHNFILICYLPFIRWFTSTNTVEVFVMLVGIWPKYTTGWLSVQGSVDFPFKINFNARVSVLFLGNTSNPRLKWDTFIITYLQSSEEFH